MSPEQRTEYLNQDRMKLTMICHEKTRFSASFFVILILMDWSTRKKVGCFAIIGAIVMVVVAYFSWKLFFSAPATCFDGKQNQNERCVDGGGICARVCPMDAKSIVPLWSRVFPVTGDVSSVVAYIENQNPTAGVQKINYEFRVYDVDNILATEPIKGTTFVGPNDKTAIFESPIKTGNRIPKTVFFNWTSAPEWTVTEKKYQVPQLSSTNVEWSDIDTAPKLSVDVVNNTLFDYRDIPVIVVLYDADGNAVNASQTYIEEIAQQSTQKVFFTWPQKFDRPILRTEILPRVNPFIQK